MNSYQTHSGGTYRLALTIVAKHILPVWIIRTILSIARYECEFVRSESDVIASVRFSLINSHIESVISPVSKNELQKVRVGTSSINNIISQLTYSEKGLM